MSKEAFSAFLSLPHNQTLNTDLFVLLEQQQLRQQAANVSHRKRSREMHRLEDKLPKCAHRRTEDD